MRNLKLEAHLVFIEIAQSDLVSTNQNH